jgi:tripartite-type tricarboxylate transporter receptor subunit TctC
MHAVADLLAEQVDVMFFMLPGVMEYIKAGKLRPLAVTTSTRVQALPDVPSLGELRPGYVNSCGMCWAAMVCFQE